MQYEIVIKGDRWCSCYTFLPLTTPAAVQTDLKMAAPGTGTGAPQMDQRLLTKHMTKNNTQHKHTCKQWHILRNSTTIHEISKQN